MKKQQKEKEAENEFMTEMKKIVQQGYEQVMNKLDAEDVAKMEQEGLIVPTNEDYEV